MGFCITIIFITKRKPRNTQFYVLVTRVHPERCFQFQKQVIIKFLVKMTKLRPFCITVVFITERKPRNTQFSVLVTNVDPEWHFQFQKQVITKILVKNDQVMTLFYNCRFYYRKEDKKNAQFSILAM